jgi:sugar phosphate isomerase/epimerase
MTSPKRERGNQFPSLALRAGVDGISHRTRRLSLLTAREGAVYVACSTQCFTRYPLERALRIIAELEFSKLDVAIHEKGPHLRPSEVAADVGQAAQRIRIGPSLSPAAFSVEIEAASPEESQHQLRAVCRLARLSTVSVITIPAAGAGTGIDAEVKRLTTLTKVAEGEGVVLTVITKIGTLTENPDTAVELCDRVPGLGLTLDPSHFLAGPHQGKNFDQVYRHVRHVHLRDTGRSPEQFQVRVGQGEVEYGRIIAQLSRCHYERLLTVAILDVADAPFAMEPEVRKLKYLLESLV